MEGNIVFYMKEAAEYIHCSLSSLRMLVEEKKIPCYKIGNRNLFRKEALDNWIKREERKSMVRAVVKDD